MTRTSLNTRLNAADWAHIAAGLDELGCAALPALVTEQEAAELADAYADERRFRSTVDMARHQFGRGQYKYFAAPLPAVVESLRAELYPRLLPIARDWWNRLRRPDPWADSLDEWLDRCHRAGQTKPTPLLLSYEAGDWNALHRDLYGELVFPLQVVVNLTRPGVDYEGGEFLLVEQRARAQSRGTSVSLPFGAGLVFTTRDRPTRSARGWSASAVRHGVSVVREGRRLTLGILFHDAA